MFPVTRWFRFLKKTQIKNHISQTIVLFSRRAGRKKCKPINLIALIVMRFIGSEGWGRREYGSASSDLSVLL